MHSCKNTKKILLAESAYNPHKHSMRPPHVRILHFFSSKNFPNRKGAWKNWKCHFFPPRSYFSFNVPMHIYILWKADIFIRADRRGPILRNANISRMKTIAFIRRQFSFFISPMTDETDVYRMGFYSGRVWLFFSNDIGMCVFRRAGERNWKISIAKNKVEFV